MRTTVEPDLKQLEREIERELAALGPWPPVAPAPECLARVQAAVRAENERCRRRTRRVWSARIGVAAAVLLAVTWAAWRPRTAAPLDAEQSLELWVAALEETSTQVGELVEVTATVGPADDAAELEDLFEGLRESLGRFETL